jgi:prolyl oligopeptidase
MSNVPHAHRVLLGLGLLLGATPAVLAAHAKDAMATPASSTPGSADPYAWLEDVTGAKPLAWVHAQNARTDAELAAAPAFASHEAELRAILDSDAKIPEVEKIGGYYYNFWKDARHERGLWRRTTLDEYRKPQPQWETVIDLDALGAAEGEKWVWHGADCLKPAYERCLVALSRGGSDADVTREFDLTTKQWVKDGFFRPESKGSLGWIDRDTVFVQTDFGNGSMTTSGYPRIAKLWRRGTPLASATQVYAGRTSDLAINAFHDTTPGFERDFVSRALDFYSDELYQRSADGALHKVDVPDSVIKSVQREWLLLQLRDPWTVAGTTYAAGSLLATRFDDFMAGGRRFDVLFAPTASTSLESFTWTRHHLVLNVLDDVKNRLSVLTPGADGWSRGAFAGAPAFGTLGVRAVDADDSDAVWLTATDYLTPTTLALADLATA